MCRKCAETKPTVTIKEKFIRWFNNDFDGNGINDYHESE